MKMKYVMFHVIAESIWCQHVIIIINYYFISFMMDEEDYGIE